MSKLLGTREERAKEMDFQIEGKIGGLMLVANALTFLFDNKDTLKKQYPELDDIVFCCEFDERNLLNFLNHIQDMIQASIGHQQDHDN